jgi:hypothetical protein
MAQDSRHRAGIVAPLARTVTVQVDRDLAAARLPSMATWSTQTVNDKVVAATPFSYADWSAVAPAAVSNSGCTRAAYSVKRFNGRLDGATGGTRTCSGCCWSYRLLHVEVSTRSMSVRAPIRIGGHVGNPRGAGLHGAGYVALGVAVAGRACSDSMASRH